MYILTLTQPNINYTTLIYYKYMYIRILMEHRNRHLQTVHDLVRYMATMTNLLDTPSLCPYARIRITLALPPHAREQGHDDDGGGDGGGGMVDGWTGRLLQFLVHRFNQLHHARTQLVLVVVE
jgi:hypothetical protein